MNTVQLLTLMVMRHVTDMLLYNPRLLLMYYKYVLYTIVHWDYIVETDKSDIYICKLSVCIIRYLSVIFSL